MLDASRAVGVVSNLLSETERDTFVADTKADPNVASECGRQAVAQNVVAMVGDLTIYGNRFMPSM